MTYQKTYRTSTTAAILVVLFVLIGAYYVYFFRDSAWLATLVGASRVPMTRWIVGIVIFAVNYMLLGRVPRTLQIVVTFVELFLLLGLFMTTFQLSLPFIRQKIGFLILQGAFTTLYVSAISIVIAFCIALVTAIARLSSNGVAVGIARFYTSFFRGLPLLIQIFILYMGFPQLGFVINPIPAGVAALSLCYGAYMSEIFRAGIQSIPVGQWEASRALGLHKSKIMRLVILPQALKIIIPPTGNHFIAMLKDSSLVSVVGVWELTYVASTVGNRDFRNMEMLITAAAIYWFMSIVLELVQSRIERRFSSATR
ncbi:amino acid ABC transporter permease [Bordetella sp.]|uniref:amino acid ABC transporter permease n=1 Tax=Bordetella sp. TaxID=28081 RepID=UPI002ED5F3E5